MDLAEILGRYGWVGLGVLYLAPRIWHFIAEKWFPQSVASKNATLQAERERQALLLKSQIEREDREFEHRKEIDNRIAAAIEGMNTSIQQMGLAITVGNERITQLISAHSRHDNFTLGAHVELKEKLEQLEEMIDTRKQVEELKQNLLDTQEKIKRVTGDGKGGQPE